MTWFPGLLITVELGSPCFDIILPLKHSDASLLSPNKWDNVLCRQESLCFDIPGKWNLSVCNHPLVSVLSRRMGSDFSGFPKSPGWWAGCWAHRRAVMNSCGWWPGLRDAVIGDGPTLLPFLFWAMMASSRERDYKGSAQHRWEEGSAVFSRNKAAVGSLRRWGVGYALGP